MRYRLLAVSGLALILASCGGDGGSGGGSGGGSSVAPVPTPTPAPTPTVPLILYRFEAVGPVRAVGTIGEPSLELHPSKFYQIAANHEGLYSGRHIVSTDGNTFQVDGTKAAYEIRGTGVDTATGEMLTVWSGPGATIVSPLNHLLSVMQSEAKVRSAVRVSANGLNLRHDVPINSTSASSGLKSSNAAEVEEATRIAAANIRIMALQAAMAHVRLPNDVFHSFAMNARESMNDVGELLAARPDLSMFDGGFELWMRNLGKHPALRDDVMQAAQSLLTNYAEAASRSSYTEQSRIQYLISIRIWLAPRIAHLIQKNDAETAARYLAVTLTDVEWETSAIGRMPPPVSAGTNYYAGSDITMVPRDGERIVPKDTDLMPRPSTRSNDILFREGGSRLVVPAATIQSVTVPDTAADKIRATLNTDQSITVTALPGFVGTAYYDYRIKADSGEEATGRGYVVVL